ncbi:hypothetical protein N7526_001663 [Penicillium atrosanguineum]|nr:hypothetical protein N7526_001663 [Penicillium atrosanguineum]
MNLVDNTCTHQSPANSRSQKKIRASRACILCHQRKVRCDALTFGFPCTNCRHDNTRCILAKKRRDRLQIDGHRLRRKEDQ